MIADIYLRVSTRRQATNSGGLARQERECRTWCATNKVIVRKIIVDVCSAYTAQHLNTLSKKHGNLGKYLSSVQEDPPDMFVFEDWDRLDRSLSGPYILGKLGEAKVKPISVFDFE